MALPIGGVVLLCTLIRFVCGDEFPNPQTDWRSCRRSKPSYLCDPDSVLDMGQAEKLDEMAHAFLRSTSCLCPKCPPNTGIPIGIYIKNNIGNNFFSSASNYPDGKLAEIIRKKWHLSSCEGDLVIILLAQHNISDFSMGPSLKKIFPQDTAMRIMKECQVHFEFQLNYQGLESIVKSFNDVLMKLQKENPATYKNLLIGIGLGFAVLLILSSAAFLLLYRQSQRNKKHCSNVYEGVSQKSRRKPSFDQEQHFQKLKRLTSSDDEEDDDTSCGQYAFKRTSNSPPGVHFMGLQRQLSAVAEESPEDIEISKRSSGLSISLNSTHNSLSRSIPVTEL